MSSNAAGRTERDSMGEFEVPADAYYGATSMRAQENFPISELRFNRSFIRALGLIKQAAAAVNEELGLLDPSLAEAIKTAAQEVVDGRFDDQFIIDIFQTGSGTSTNMNANEVISNRAIELLGGERGSRIPVHPNDHVNAGQSSNDVIPAAIHVAAAVGLHEDLLPALSALERSLRAKSEEFWPIIKTGRTHLQDATPIRLGQEFLGYAGQVERSRRRVSQGLSELRELALGGTAVGTGVGTHPEFPARVIARLAVATGIGFVESDNHFQAQATLDSVVAASGALRSVAVSLYKIASDIRLMGFGPRAGLAEIEIPAVQPGSSIMPGKVNPVILESVTMVAAQVIGNDATVAFAGAAGSLLELNVMMPVAAYNLLQSISLLANSAGNLATRCVDGLRATENGPALVERGLMTTTSLAPRIGYDQAGAIAKEAYASGRTIREVARERTGLSEDELTTLLDPEAMTAPGRDSGGAGG
ncbi:MAG: class II fumarate hydratase [Candidatus Dormibacteraeota bacterium]|uniref:Fumarate hydratase class II n=1 Tax=Candidatus Aeolococcus gillhamiae TaxID=3127015 RepID=A0A2W5YZ14_9BACT|nr:class II fumarate hydratase [Candidatus Dormibacteraeota bacterium]PZR78213.1 MAG: aspartate ammonia-lyase [Candidatus Dormibacter sp. RRmetagenome_bin12]